MPWFNIMMSSYQYGVYHWGDRTVVRWFYSQSWNSYNDLPSLSRLSAQFHPRTIFYCCEKYEMFELWSIVDGSYNLGNMNYFLERGEREDRAWEERRGRGESESSLPAIGLVCRSLCFEGDRSLLFNSVVHFLTLYCILLALISPQNMQRKIQEKPNASACVYRDAWNR